MQSNIVVIDFSVIAYRIIEDLTKSRIHELPIKLDPKVPSQRLLINKLGSRSRKTLIERFIRLSWLKYLHWCCPEMPCRSFIPVVVLDTKRYWRTKVYPDYKGGRKPKPLIFSKVRSLGKKVLKEEGVFNLGFYGLEADDCAAMVVKTQAICGKVCNPSPNMVALANAHTYLFTVDSDWLQMVGETPKVTWVDVYHYGEKVRGVEETKAWALRRLKVSLRIPQDIAAVKAIKGDASDNLPPGTDISMIDLFNPPQAYRYLDRPAILSKILSIPDQPLNNLDKAQRALKLLSVYAVWANDYHDT